MQLVILVLCRVKPLKRRQLKPSDLVLSNRYVSEFIRTILLHCTATNNNENNNWLKTHFYSEQTGSKCLKHKEKVH